MVLDGTAELPVPIPDFLSQDNTTSRMTRLELDAAGLLKGDSTETYHGASAEIWPQPPARLHSRRSARDRRPRGSEGDRPRRPRRVGADRQLDDDTQDLVIRFGWRPRGTSPSPTTASSSNLNLRNRVPVSDWAAANRKVDIDLDRVRDETETVELTLPEKVLLATFPLPANLKMGQAALFEATYLRKDRVVTFKRHLRLDSCRFPRIRIPR